jgi:ribonucleoside-diphosphate reductase alpha chain
MIRPSNNSPLPHRLLSEHIDYSADNHMIPAGAETVKDRYLVQNEKSPQDAYMRCATAFASNEAHALRMYSYFKKHWAGPASPVLANAPVRIKFFENMAKNFSHLAYESVYGPLPISCYTGYVPDSRVGIADHLTESLWIASNGGGYAAYWGDLRPEGSVTSTGGKSGGLVPFFHVEDSMVTAAHQGSNRRAVYGGNIRCDHPEVVEFIESRKMSGDPNKRSRNIFQAILVSDKFMHAVLDDADWHLVDHKGVTKEIISARYLWELMLELPFETGCPFLVFEDTCRRFLPEEQKALGLDFHNVNICTEITLANNEERTAVCCLSSYNMSTYNEWKGNRQFIKDMVEFLDNVLEYFIQNAIWSCTKDFAWEELAQTLRESHYEATGIMLEDSQVQAICINLVEKRFMGLRKAVYSAKQERAIGLGSMGWDSYFKICDLPYESREALDITYNVTKWVKEVALEATYELGAKRGPAPDMQASGRRNSHLLADAPTATNSLICGGVTPSREPRFQNVYAQQTTSGTFQIIEPYLLKCLEKYGKNNAAVIKSIVDNEGSVQHLDFLNAHEKKVLRTAFEVDQMWIVEHVACAQKDVCQAISTNLFMKPGVPRSYVNAVHFQMWKKGCKTRYYIRTMALASSNAFAKAEKSADTIDYNRADIFTACLSCEG